MPVATDSQHEINASLDSESLTSGAVSSSRVDHHDSSGTVAVSGLNFASGGLVINLLCKVFSCSSSVTVLIAG
jgi:hypothetical protein